MTANLQLPSDPTAARYLAGYEALKADLPGASHEWVATLRGQGAEILSQTGLPTRREETWKYTDLRSLYNAKFSSLKSNLDTVPEIISLMIEDAHVVVFIDGYYAPELSRVNNLPGGVEIASLADCLNHGALEKLGCLSRVADMRQPGFVAVNTILMQDGAICRVKNGVVIDKPIQLIFATSVDTANETHLRNVIELGVNAQATVIQSYVSLGTSSGFFDATSEIHLEEGGSLHHVLHQNQSAASWHVNLVAARLQRNATFDNFLLTTGARLARNEIRVQLADEGAETTLKGMALLRDRQHCDNTTDVDHAVGHGYSKQLYKNVLDDRARSVFQGRIHVASNAQKTNAHQMNRNLLLSRNAQADSKPELIIHADDVKCSHGATVGELDQDAKFYLCSRGIDPVTAQNMMVQGFASEMIDDVSNDTVRSYLEAYITTWLNGPTTVEEVA